MQSMEALPRLKQSASLPYLPASSVEPRRRPHWEDNNVSVSASRGDASRRRHRKEAHTQLENQALLPRLSASSSRWSQQRRHSIASLPRLTSDRIEAGKRPQPAALQERTVQRGSGSRLDVHDCHQPRKSSATTTEVHPPRRSSIPLNVVPLPRRNSASTIELPGMFKADVRQFMRKRDLAANSRRLVSERPPPSVEEPPRSAQHDHNSSDTQPVRSRRLNRRLSEAFTEPGAFSAVQTAEVSEPVSHRSNAASDCDDTTTEETSTALLGACKQHIEFMPTFDDALARYVDDGFNLTERQRMRLAFIRFADAESGEIRVDQLQDILIHLDYLTAGGNGISLAALVPSLAMKSTFFSTMSFEEFQEFAAEFAGFESVAISQKAAECARASYHTIEEIQELLQKFGVIVRQEVASEMMDIAKVELSDGLEDIALDQKDILKLVAAYRALHGFTLEEMERAKAIYDELDRLPPTRQSAKTGCPVKATELTNGLLEFGGPYCIPYLTQLVDKTEMPESDDAPGLSFYEFIVWARCLHNIGMESLADAFQKARADGRGRVNLEGMLKAVAELGFTLLENALGELLRQIDLERGQESVDFSTFISFVTACRHTHGFTEAEHQDFLDLYKRFDRDGDSELDHLEFLSMLRHQGHTTKLIDAQNLIRQVDFNHNGTMDRLEFMRLMRLQREKVVENARSAFDWARGIGNALPTGEMVHALERYGISLRSEVLEDLESMHKGKATLQFDEFVYTVERAQEIAAVELRKRAGFSIETFRILERTFRSYDKAGAGSLSTGELMWILCEAGVPAHTVEEREEVLKSLEAARDAALEAGCKEGDECEHRSMLGRNRRVFFWEFLHLVRGFARDNDEKSSDRQKAAIEQAKFTPAEVETFRIAFGKAVDDYEAEKQGSDENARRRRAKEHLQDLLGDSRISLSSVQDQSLKEDCQGLGSVLKDMFSESALPRNDIRFLAKVLSSLGLTVSMQQREELEDKLFELTEDEMDIDFACFLLLVRWLLDAGHAKPPQRTASGTVLAGV